MKLRHGLACSLLVTVILGLAFSAAGAATIPDWVKGVAGWWSQDKISEQEFLQGIDYLISSGAIKPKIIEEKDAKIKSLETELAKYKATAKPVQTYPELRESTRLWSAKQLTDAAYLQQVQSLVDRGIIGPWSSQQGCGDAFCSFNIEELSDSDKKLIFDGFRKLATAWSNGQIEDVVFLGHLEQMYQYRYINNPKGQIADSTEKLEIAPIEKTESERIYDEQIAKQAAMDSSHAKLMDNAKQWQYGYISTETYLENIVQMYQGGVFLPFLSYSQQARGDYDKVFIAQAISGIVQDKALVEELRLATQQYLKDETDTGYIPNIGGVFGSSLGK